MLLFEKLKSFIKGHPVQKRAPENCILWYPGGLGLLTRPNCRIGVPWKISLYILPDCTGWNQPGSPCWEKVTGKTDKLTCLTRGSHAKSGGRHEFPSEIEAEVLTYQEEFLRMCVLGKTQRSTRVAWVRRMSPRSCGSYGSSSWRPQYSKTWGLVRTETSLDPDSPCVTQSWGTLNSLPLKNTGHSQEQNSTGQVLRLDWALGAWLACCGANLGRELLH